MTPPKLAAWLLAIAAPAAERGDLLADLAEEADARVHTDGLAAARRWYWRQVLTSLAPLVARRLGQIGRPTLRVVDVGRDVRVALRSIRRSPVFASSVVLMLAVGIGAHVVVSAMVDGLVLRPLPFGDRSPRLVTLHGTHPTQAAEWRNARISYPDLRDFQAQATSLEAIEGVVARNLSVATTQDSDRVPAASVTPGLFTLLNVVPLMGRGFVDTDAADIGFESVVIVSHALWQTLLGGDRQAVGKALWINGRPLTVVGVMPPGFSFPDGQQAWLPYRGPLTSGRDQRGLLGVALLRPSVTRQQAEAELQGIASQLAGRYPATNRGWGVHAIPMRDFFVSGGAPSTLVAAATLVLIVVCANVSGLLVARGVVRQRELSLRAAFGAGRWRIARLLLVEIGMLSLIGGLAGLALAAWGVRAWNAWDPEPPPFWARPEFDLRVGLFAVGLTGCVALFAGLVPALRLSRADAGGALLPGARLVGATRGHRRLQRGLVVAQVAVSLALLVAAGLLNQSASALLHADGGFDVHPLLSLRFYIAGDRYDAPAARGTLANEIVARVSAIPGVIAAGATGSIPTDDGGAGAAVIPPGAEARPDQQLGVQLVPAGPTFWEAIGHGLNAGRTFTIAENVDPQAAVAIVNGRLAARLWGRESALGRTIRLADAAGPIALRVIGVAPDVVYEEFGEETPQSQLNVYVPIARAGWRTEALLVNVDHTLDPGSLAQAVRGAIRQVDPTIAVYDVMTMADRRAYNHWFNRFLGRTSGVFAAAALLLACIGAYGLGAYLVAERTREIGVRLALGSTREAITRMFLGVGGRIAAAGLCAGAVLAVLSARMLQHEGALFRTSPWTASVWIGPAMMLVAAIFAASYLPARRASRVDPAVTLRREN